MAKTTVLTALLYVMYAICLIACVKLCLYMFGNTIGCNVAILVGASGTTAVFAKLWQAINIPRMRQ